MPAAVMHDLAHLEVAVRNAYNGALEARQPGPLHWTDDLGRHFPYRRGRAADGTVIDRNATPRRQVQRAINDAGGVAAPKGKIIAELSFGFWRYLTTRAHDATLWLPYLRWGFAAGMNGTGPVALSRPVVDRAMGELHMLRNRVAHHEPLLNTDLAARWSNMLLLLDLIDPDLSRHVQHHSTWAIVKPVAHDDTPSGTRSADATTTITRTGMRIRRLDIENFRGISKLTWIVPDQRTFITLVGPGDSTKSTLLTAVERALSDRWNSAFQDTDFHGGDVESAISIRVALVDLADELMALDALGACLCGINPDGSLTHDPQEDNEACIVVELFVQADLEPQWRTYRPGDSDPAQIKASLRSRFGVYRVDERVDTHLRWSRTSALGKLTEAHLAPRRRLRPGVPGVRAQRCGASPVRRSLDTILDGHLPYPAMIARPHGVLVAANRVFELESRDGHLRLFTTLTSFATATDIALAEPELEAFAPADEATADVLRKRGEQW